MARIAVHGSATRVVAPERGTLHLSVTVTCDTRGAVLDTARRAHAAVVVLATAAVDAGTATDWVSPEVHAWAYQDWVPLPAEAGLPGQSQQVTRYRAGADLQVTFARTDAIAELVSAVGELEHVDVQRVDWDLTPQTREELLRELRTDAARDAVGRAGDYAAALGLGEPRITALYEAGLHPGLGASGPGGAPPMLARAVVADTGPGFELRPRDLEVTATVTAELDAAGG